MSPAPGPNVTLAVPGGIFILCVTPARLTLTSPNEPVEVAEPLTSPSAVISNDFDAPPPGLNLNFVPLEPPLNSKPVLSYGPNTH
mgnify:CR=1 FL=1